MLLGVTGSPGRRGGDRCFPALLAPRLTSALPSVQAHEGGGGQGGGWEGTGESKENKEGSGQEGRDGGTDGGWADRAEKN